MTKEPINPNLIEMMAKHVGNSGKFLRLATEEMEKGQHCLAQAIGLEHKDQLTCTVCGYSGPEHVEKPISVCPVCESGRIKFHPNNKTKTS